MKITTILKGILIGLILASIFIIGCKKKDTNPDEQSNVKLSSPTVEPGGDLSINATARFDVEVTGASGIDTLIYEWTLREGRGTLIISNSPYGDHVEIFSPYVNVRGDKAGEETILVNVKDVSGNSLGKDQLTFNITEPSGTSGCFDEPMLFYRDNNPGNPRMSHLGLETGTIKTTHLDPNNWHMDISPDGNWFIREYFPDYANNEIWIDACDGSESKKLAEGPHINSPTFGPDGKYVYYTELIDYPEQTQDPRAEEIVRVNIESGEKEFISDFRVFAKSPKVSPDGKWIVFEHNKETFNENGSYAGSIIHLAVMPSEGGPAQFLVPIEGGRIGPNFDWSPDSKDIIFYFNEYTNNDGPLIEGIYRVYLNGGGGASLIYDYGITGSSRKIAYYANGTRIAFEGHPAGDDTQYDIWSIDANGDDLQRLTDEQYNVFLTFIWEPKTK